jgi:hypothetical protein
MGGTIVVRESRTHPGGTAASEYDYTDDTVRDPEIERMVAEDVRRFPTACEGKEDMLEILHASNFTPITSNVCFKLPHKEQLEELYGTGPVVYGMETCQAYREAVAEARGREKGSNNKTANHHIAPMVRVAGLFKTGTNALAKSFHRNLKHDHDVWDAGVRAKVDVEGDWLDVYNVPWDKHVPVKFRWNNTVPSDQGIDMNLVLPVVLVRDPYWWMKSMVRHNGQCNCW